MTPKVRRGYCHASRVQRLGKNGENKPLMFHMSPFRRAAAAAAAVVLTLSRPHQARAELSPNPTQSRSRASASACFHGGGGTTAAHSRRRHSRPPRSPPSFRHPGRERVVVVPGGGFGGDGSVNDVVDRRDTVRLDAVGPKHVVDTVAKVAASQAFRRFLDHGATKFLSNWKMYGAIPLIAGFVGWFTNYLAVQMIFYPIKWRGLPIFRVEGEPLGLLGWQGIVPAKTLKMSEAMVNATISELLTMEEIIQRLDPERVADILAPECGKIVQPFVDELLVDRPEYVKKFASEFSSDSDGFVQNNVGRKFLGDLTRDMQGDIGSVLNLRNCVVDLMMSDRALLGKLFQVSGKDELAFLTDSGLWFGFLLGLCQLAVALYWDNPWTLSVGGLIVGLATNWLALKWIFEPVNPTKIGPLVLQGLFLRRQKEVSADFSNFFATRVLTSRQLWTSILTDATTLPAFESLLAARFADTARELSFGIVDIKAGSRRLKTAATKCCSNLLGYLNNLHEYADEALEIEPTLRARMSAMTSAQFERVLHPIFEEDETTLILSGGGLGFAAGYVQQAVATGALVLPRFSLGGTTRLFRSCLSLIGLYSIFLALKPKKNLEVFVERLIERTMRLKRKTRRTVRYWRRKSDDAYDPATL